MALGKCRSGESPPIGAAIRKCQGERAVIYMANLSNPSEGKQHNLLF